MQNLWGIIISMAYIFAVLGLATLVAKLSKGASENSRKMVHILVGNWVFITPLFTRLWAVLLVPFSFIIINSLSLKYKTFSAMERNDDSLGTVYYAVSMFVLSGAGFLLGWRTLPFIGLLTMAYGDGLAAVIGKKWGRRRPFGFAPEKTVAGALTVAVTAFIVTAVSIYVLGEAQNAADTGIWAVLIIALSTAVIAVFSELIGKRGCDNLTLPIGSGLFATLCLQFGSLALAVYLLISAAILLSAYRLHAITPDGMVAAILTALTLYALGGVWLGISLLVFFILGSAVSRLKNERKLRAEQIQEEGGARNWKQVLCNSLPACILIWLAFIFPEQKIFILLAFSVFSAAAADTFSSEIGMLSRSKAFNILTGKPVQNGLSRGVTWAGLGAGLLGSVLLSLLVLAQYSLRDMLFVALLGFLGSVIDSVLGAALQRKYRGPDGSLQDKAEAINEKPASGYRIISNNAVNLISLIIIACLGSVYYLIAAVL
jgi:uncharacterized protein (TIGR00297 family)